MSLDMTITPSAFGALRVGLGRAAENAAAAGGDIVSVDPIAFTRAAADAASTGLSSALEGSQAICQALGATTTSARDRLDATVRSYRAVEDAGVALAGTIDALLDEVPA